MTDSALPPGNWGRWGERDERGAANLAGPAEVRDAARLVERGAVYPLGLEISSRRVLSHPGRPAPQHFMTLDGGDYAAGLELPGGMQYADDYLMTALHGSTHIDALAHAWTDGKLYNGHPASTVRSNGARRCGIDKLGALVTRGVLLDLAAHFGVPHLDPEYVVTDAELRDCALAQGVDFRPGDCILMRTGWQRVFDDAPAKYHASSPGIGRTAAGFLATADPCAVGSDTITVEVRRADGTYDGGSPALVVHPILIRDHGIYMIELLQLDRLAEDRVYEFLFVLAPLMIAGGTAGPVNPLAIA